ncbi:MAG: MoxR family ATPase [Lachnospiraceae bacterium]|nr:MoxR family ATPase [Lachnospiraceae bacterium]
MIRKLRDNINQTFVGKEEVVENVLVCLLAGGHVLLEDVPGAGKTTLAKTLAKSIACSFGRIQFTPDTLPSDVTGLSVYNMKTGEFEYREGVIMHEILLADEINRTSPKTQASLLEAMAEGTVTVDGKIYPLPSPFIVLATQNPVEFLGTFPLPEAQLDRFMMRLTIGYPEEAGELRMARNYLNGVDTDKVVSVCTAEDIIEMRKAVSAVHVSDALLAYVRGIIAETRKEKRFVLGASPRAFLHLLSTSRAKAYLEGRDFVKPDDVKAVSANTLHHRLQLTPEARLQKEDTDQVIRDLLYRVILPLE